jgi:magnesium-transporting ATPase (P-type)
VISYTSSLNEEGGMETPVKKTWKSTLAGVLSIVAGVLSSIGFLAMIVAVAAVGSSEVVLDALRDAGFSGGVSLLQTILIIVAIFSAITATLALIGGIFALQRKRWGWALAGSIAAILCSWPLGIAATVFTAISKDEFK